MKQRELRYTGERLVPGDERLAQLLVEDLAKFRFALPYAAGKKVLDAGCGAGQGTAYLARSGASDVTGVDVAEDAIAFARNHWPLPNLKFAVMDVSKLDFPDATFETVTSIEVIEHLTSYREYVSEIRRVMKEGGILVLSTPNRLVTSPRPGMMWPFHIHEFEPEELRELLSEHFATVRMLALTIPVYDEHPIRRLVHRLAPVLKPILPMRLRTKSLPWLQARIKQDVTLEDIVITDEMIDEKSTLMAVCTA